MTKSVDDFVDVFGRMRPNHALAQEKFKKLYPKLKVQKLPLLEDTDTVVFKASDANVFGTHTLLVRGSQQVSKEGLERIYQATRKLFASKPVCYEKKNDNRSSTPALHLGIWKIYRSQVTLTKATVDQTAETIERMDVLFRCLQTYIVPKLVRILETYFPEQWEEQKK